MSSVALPRDAMERLLVAELKRGTTRHVRVAVCCNDWQAKFLGRTAHLSFEFQRGSLDLTSTCGESAFTVDHEAMWFRIHRLLIGFTAHRNTYANFYWDSFVIDRIDALRLIHLMASQGKYACESGPTRFVNWWDRLVELNRSGKTS